METIPSEDRESKRAETVEVSLPARGNLSRVGTALESTALASARAKTSFWKFGKHSGVTAFPASIQSPTIWKTFRSPTEEKSSRTFVLLVFWLKSSFVEETFYL